jgi:hypothetical protein
MIWNVGQLLVSYHVILIVAIFKAAMESYARTNGFAG